MDHELDTAQLREDLKEHFDQYQGDLMLESADKAFYARLEQQLGAALDKLDHDSAMLESVTRADEQRKAAMTNFIKRVPVFLTTRQRTALENLGEPGTVDVVIGLFESVLASSLPTEVRQRQALPQRGGNARKSSTGGKPAAFTVSQPGKPPIFG